MERLFSVMTLLALVFAASCSPMYQARGPSEWPEEVEEALAKAGDNRAELEKVLHHYKEAGDPQKLRAAEYLIANMEGHSYQILAICDSAKVIVELDVLAYPTYDSLVVVMEAIEKERGELNYKRDDEMKDLENISADLLIEHIDLAFLAWREKPWASGLSFEAFLDYVLPHRGSGEPLESWRPYFLERYADLPERMENPADPIEAARFINEDLMTWFTFDPRFYLHPTDQGLSEMIETGIGRCEDMTNLAIYAMRANGIAVTSDYTPHWANTGNNHAWNSVLDGSGNAIVFMGCEAHPGKYTLHNKAAKVYRKMYAKQRENLVFQKPEWEKVPRWLGGRNYLDVTPAYVDIADVTVKLEKAAPDSARHAYLCVFNDAHWRAIQWGKIEGRHATFVGMGTEVVYLPAYYRNEEIIPAGEPFILQVDGGMRLLRPGVVLQEPMRLAGTTTRAQARSTDSIAKANLEVGRSYELFFWDDEWISAGKAAASEEPLEFAGFPGDALYWLVAEESRKEERIFTYEDGNQVWW